METRDTDMQIAASAIRQRRADSAVQQVYADQVAKAGRDLMIFGLLTTAYAIFGRPPLSDDALTLMRMAGPSGCLAYCVCLYFGMRLRRKASLLAADLPTEE